MTTTFASLGIPEGLAGLLDELGFRAPFEVQTATIPDALAGRDIAARAPTGSGKTLAFGLPLLMHVEGARPRRPRGLVLAPTRELADQIQRELDPIARAGGRSVIAVYGGVGYEPQKRALARGVDVLVACPGRLADLIGQGELDLNEVEFVVVDEADRMSDMGFLPEVKRLLDRTPDTRQTLLFSATLDGEVAVLTRRYQRDPVRHEVGEMEPDVEDMRHLFWRLEASGRVEVASNLIQAAGRTIVFCRTRRGADRVAKQLHRAGVSAAAIHGSRSQGQRTRALKAFTDGKVEALVATDLAARGIHVDGVACILHFDPPVDDKTYIHRSGRTARAGAHGIVVSFIAGDELRQAGQLVQRLRLHADLNTPAPASLQGAMERLNADPETSFADAGLGRVDAEPAPRRQRPHAGAPAEARSGARRRNNRSRPRGSVPGSDVPRGDRAGAAGADSSPGDRRSESGERDHGGRDRDSGGASGRRRSNGSGPPRDAAVRPRKSRPSTGGRAATATSGRSRSRNR